VLPAAHHAIVIYLYMDLTFTTARLAGLTIIQTLLLHLYGTLVELVPLARAQSTIYRSAKSRGYMMTKTQSTLNPATPPQKLHTLPHLGLYSVKKAKDRDPLGSPLRVLENKNNKIAKFGRRPKMSRTPLTIVSFERSAKWLIHVQTHSNGKLVTAIHI
jgi:hypothetical protein